MQCCFPARVVRFTFWVSVFYLIALCLPADQSLTRMDGPVLACSEAETGASDFLGEDPSSLTDPRGNNEKQDSQQLRTMSASSSPSSAQHVRARDLCARKASSLLLPSVRLWSPRKLPPPTAVNEPPLCVPA